MKWAIVFVLPLGINPWMIIWDWDGSLTQKLQHKDNQTVLQMEYGKHDMSLKKVAKWWLQ